MALPSPQYLAKEQICELLREFDPETNVNVYRIRYKNGNPIRTPIEMKIEELKSFILECLKEEDQPGGDLEVILPSAGKTLVGHHDGIYWLEPMA